MFVVNGIVYGGEPKEQLKITDFKILPDKIMILTFSNGESRLFDATILTGPVFEKLNNESIFCNPKIDHGIITWANGDIDCSPEFMYKNSYEYSNLEVI